MKDKFNEYELYVFDFDGTLLDSSLDVIDSINEVLAFYNKPKGSDDAIRFSIGGELRKIFDSALDDPEGFDFEQAESMFIEAYHHNCANRSTLYPNAREILHQLKAKGKRLALFTTKENKDTNKILKHLDLEDMFEIVVARQDVVQAKPHPEGLLKIVDYFKPIPKESILMIGDTYYDLVAGHRASVDTMIIRHGYDKTVLKQKEQPTYVLREYRELLDN